jgi:hypothetical protein
MSEMHATQVAPPAPPTPPAYPATLEIDYPDRKLNRLTSFFRIFVAIPILIVLNCVGGILSVPPVLMILFRKKYPKWWFDWNLALSRFNYRVSAYISLLRDEYPSTDEEQSVHLDMVYPEAQAQLRRGLPLVKWFLAMPHWVIIYFLGIAACVCMIIAWFVILFTGRYPKALFDFEVGVMRWGLRVEAYACLLITDKYPPFSF